MTYLADVPPERPVYLVGEGFGAVVALAVVAEAGQGRCAALAKHNHQTAHTWLLVCKHDVGPAIQSMASSVVLTCCRHMNLVCHVQHHVAEQLGWLMNSHCMPAYAMRMYCRIISSSVSPALPFIAMHSPVALVCMRTV